MAIFSGVVFEAVRKSIGLQVLLAIGTLLIVRQNPSCYHF